MSSRQLTLADVPTEAPEEPDTAPGIGDVPNFNREGGVERTELGADLAELCAQTGENDPTRPRERVQLPDVGDEP